MKKKIEKEIENDLLSSLPENDLKFEKIEGRIDYSRFKTTKKKSKRKMILIPLGSIAALALVAFAIPVIVIATRPVGNGGSTRNPKEGTYSLSLISGDDISISFEVGQKVIVSSSSEIDKGSLLLTRSEWNYEGRLHFEDGPLSEVSLTYGEKKLGNLLFSFDYSGASYDGSVTFFSPVNERAHLEVTLSDSSAKTLTLTYS